MISDILLAYIETSNKSGNGTPLIRKNSSYFLMKQFFHYRNESY